ncbi:MAG TPA: hypothetical protein PKZ99_04490 [Azospirillaceae bacterium]|nr:hypothetical protein [Azospirillaceae bacterium]
MAESQRFVDLGKPRRIWAVGAIHAEADRLRGVHAALAARFCVGDRIVYLGNMIGRGAAVIETIDELLAFRRLALAARGACVDDVVYLRGGQEEMWRSLLQLQFAPNPAEVLDWMLGQGVAATLAAYGGDPAQGFAAARGGAVSLTRWTQGLRAAFYARPGHEQLFSALRRAAHVGQPHDARANGGEAAPLGAARPLSGPLFVCAGVDPSRPFALQGDRFWWGAAGFARMEAPFSGFARVVRGYDPGKGGAAAGDFHATLDGGCGFGGALVCAGFDSAGQLIDSFQV